VLAAAGFARFASASGWIRRHHLAISRIGALLMLAVGALLVSGLWDGLIGYLQSWTSGYEVPL
jgi:cytochrome c-type biogenesis protein